MNRRALLLAPLLTPALALAQEPRPVRLVLPFPAGGPTDAVARLMAPRLAARLSQPVVIDNRPGAGGVPAAEVVVRAPPDGQTLLLTTNSTHSTGPALMRLPYDPDRDFTPIALLAASPNLLVIAPSVPATDLAGFLAWARAHPGDVNYGSSGVGTIPHLMGALFNALTNLGMVHVPYRGTGGVYAELRRGDVHLLFDPPLTAEPNIASGGARGLATTGAARSPLAPDLPTVGEAGVANFVVETWFGLYGPAHLPPPLQTSLSAAAQAVMAEPDLRQQLLALGVEARPGGPDVLVRTATEDRERWTRLVRDLGIRPND